MVYNKNKTKGMSNIISIILLIIVVIGLLVFTAVVVFDIDERLLAPSVDATVQLDETSDGVKATITHNENVDYFMLQHEDGSSTTINSTENNGTLDKGSGEYELIGYVDDYDESLSQITVDANTDGLASDSIDNTVITGSVSRNPLIPNASVTAYNESGGAIQERTTDNNGSFEFQFNESKSVDVIVEVDGVELNISNEKIDYYTGDVATANTGERIEFEFNSEHEIKCEVQSNESLVNYVVEDNTYQIATTGQTYCIDDKNIGSNYELLQSIEDTTGDNLSDYRQMNILNTNPAVNDTTGDGLKDAKQVFELNTNPAVNDTTGDGLDDAIQFFELDTDPTVNDTTNDGLKDAEQYFEIGTDPAVNDTTGDGLYDSIQVLELNTDPLTNDTTGDGLSDAYQYFELGTNPAVNYTTEDGFSDIYAYESSQLEPTENNVKVSISYMDESFIPDLQPIKNNFKNAPIDNEYGEDGINLIFSIDSESVDKQSIEHPSHYDDYYEENYVDKNKDDNGYYHLLLVEDIDFNTGETILGYTYKSYNFGEHHGMVVQDLSDSYLLNHENAVQATIQHELGHQLGLWTDTYDGIDSTKYDCRQYNSVMNYNCNININNSFSDENSSFNDWDYIHNNLNNTNPKTE